VKRLSDRTRNIAGVILVVVGAVLLFAGTIAFYAREQLINQEAFADRAVEALEDDGVRHLVSREIVVNLIDRGSTDLVAARPLLESVVDTVVGTQPFRRVFRAAARETNRVFFVRERGNALFDLGDSAEIVQFALRSVSPRVAKEIPKDLKPQLLTLRRRDFAGTTLAVADDVRVLGVVLPLLALAVLAAAVVVSPDRRVGLLRTGVAVGATGALLAATLLILRARTLAGVIGEDEVTDEEVRDAVAGVLDAYLGDLVVWGLLLALLGLLVGAAAAALEPDAADLPTARLRRRLLGRPPTRLGRAVRGAAALIVGIAVVLNPTLSVQVLAIAAGAYLVFLGTSELLALLQLSGEPRAEARRTRTRALAAAGVASGTVVAVLVVLVLVVTSGGPESRGAPTSSPGTCNGSAAYCDLRLNQAVFAGTHNSFSAADSPGWFIANQRRTIGRQLKDGIRLFLIDPHWGVESEDGRVRTDFEAEGRDRNRVAKGMPPQVLKAAERLTGRLGVRGSGGDRDLWLCHTVCELGATRMVDSLEVVRKFLDDNRGEVVILFIEPYVPPAEIAKTFERAGLDRYVATLARDEPLPTLGQLVRRNRRVIVFTEKDADGTVPWYLDGFSFVQDTPLGATRRDELSCERERGSADSPLLMLNHWADLFPPRLEANRPFQEKKFVLSRAHRCARVNGLPVNLIAVDHYDQGDLIEAVEELNDEGVAARTD
jgi:uncharacterized membrane protein HdeD (DUF308 family)